MIFPIMAFGCGFALGLVLSRRESPALAPKQYQPTEFEIEVANLLGVDDLRFGAYLYGAEGLAAMLMREQQPS